MAAAAMAVVRADRGWFRYAAAAGTISAMIDRLETGRIISARRKLLFALVATAGLIGLLEGGARIALLALGAGGAPIEVQWEGQGAGQAPLRDALYRPDERCFFLLKPNVELGQTPNPRIFDVRTNALGLRGREVSAQKPPGTLRVLCLGDSCTFGSGSGGDDTYPARLERVLREAHPDRKVEVLNAGVPGFTSYQCMKYLETEGVKLEPDVVVVAVGFNDSMPAQGGEKRAIPAGVEMTDWEYAATLKGPGRLGITRLIRRLTAPSAPPPPPGPQAPAKAPEAWPPGKVRVPRGEYREYLASMIDLCARHGATAVIVAWPILPQMTGETLLGRSKEIEVYQQIAAEVARERGAAFVDLPKALAGHPDVFIDIVHMNGEGYGLVAQAVAEELPNAETRKRGDAETQIQPATEK